LSLREKEVAKDDVEPADGLVLKAAESAEQSVNDEGSV